MTVDLCQTLRRCTLYYKRKANSIDHTHTISYSSHNLRVLHSNNIWFICTSHEIYKNVQQRIVLLVLFPLHFAESPQKFSLTETYAMAFKTNTKHFVGQGTRQQLQLALPPFNPAIKIKADVPSLVVLPQRALYILKPQVIKIAEIIFSEFWSNTLRPVVSTVAQQQRMRFCA